MKILSCEEVINNNILTNDYIWLISSINGRYLGKDCLYNKGYYFITDQVITICA